MAEEGITNEQIDKFLAKVTSLREGQNCKNESPGVVVDMAARNVGLGSAVLELVCAALRRVVDCESVEFEDVRFWISAAVGVSTHAGSFKKDWLDAFNSQFFGLVSGARDLPSPYELKLPREVAKQFHCMLQTAVAVAENRGKIGKTANNKVPGFREVKYWSESAGWTVVDGFTAADRELLKALAAGNASLAAPTAVKGASGVGELADARKRVEDLKLKLHEEQKNSFRYQEQAQKLSRELEKTNAELVAVQKKCEFKADEIAGADAKLNAMQKELELARDKANRDCCVHQQQEDDLRRQIANAENRLKAQNDAIADVVTPIRRQIEDAKTAAMSEALCRVLLTHLVRIIDTLKANGFEV